MRLRLTVRHPSPSLVVAAFNACRRPLTSHSLADVLAVVRPSASHHPAITLEGRDPRLPAAATAAASAGGASAMGLLHFYLYMVSEVGKLSC